MLPHNFFLLKIIIVVTVLLIEFLSITATCSCPLSVREYNVSSSDGFADKMKREHIVSFVQLRMKLDATIDNRLDISKDVAPPGNEMLYANP